MPITHEQARRLVDFKADDALAKAEKISLDEHLRSCAQCREYAASLNDMEAGLQALLRRRWSQSPLPFSASRGPSSRSSILNKESIFFATRIAAMGVICIAFLFNIWEFTQSGRTGAKPPSAEIPSIPTPSVQSTTTDMCEPILYEVRQGDSLESIAIQYSLTVDTIVTANPLSQVGLDPGMKLSLPVCGSTPPGTPRTVVTTYTPLLSPALSTPSNGPTQ